MALTMVKIMIELIIEKISATQNALKMRISIYSQY